MTSPMTTNEIENKIAMVESELSNAARYALLCVIGSGFSCICAVVLGVMFFSSTAHQEILAIGATSSFALFCVLLLCWRIRKPKESDIRRDFNNLQKVTSTVFINEIAEWSSQNPAIRDYLAAVKTTGRTYIILEEYLSLKTTHSNEVLFADL